MLHRTEHIEGIVNYVIAGGVSKSMKLILRSLLVVLGLLLLQSAWAEKTADPDKVLRFAFIAAEDGFP